VETQFNNIYLRVEDIYDLKLLIGGTEMQRFHEDVAPKADHQDDASIKKAIQNRCVTMLLNCNLGSPVRLACCAMNIPDDRWSEIRCNFRRKRGKTRAYIREPDEIGVPYKIFECAGVVFAGHVRHAGMPVPHYSQAGEDSAIKKLEERDAHKMEEVDLPFLKTLKGLSEITRLFVTTWPQDEFGNKEDWIETGAVAVDSDDDWQ